MLSTGCSICAEDVEIGHRLMGDDGSYRNVIELHRGLEQMVKITPVKGEPFVVNINHILSLIHTTSGNIVDISVKDWLLKNQTFKHCHKLYRSSSINFERSVEALPVHPWWLGIRIGLCNLTSENKYIPDIYKYSTVENRMEILAGLLDIDCHYANGGYYFISKSKQLSLDVVFIARSLGLAAYIKPSEKYSQDGVSGIYWRVTISGDLSMLPTIKHINRERLQKKNVLSD